MSRALQNGYNDRLQAIQRQQSLALNQLQHTSLSREESLLSAAELLSQAAASMASPHAHGLPQLAFGPGSGFDNALNSPMTPQPHVSPQICVLFSQGLVGSIGGFCSLIEPTVDLYDCWSLMVSLPEAVMLTLFLISFDCDTPERHLAAGS